MKNIKLILLCIIFMSAPFSAIASETIGKIKNLRASTEQHPSANSKGKMFFQLTTALHENCTWLYIDSGNSYFASALFSAEAKKQDVKIWYSTEVTNGQCKAYTIQLN